MNWIESTHSKEHSRNKNRTSSQQHIIILSLHSIVKTMCLHEKCDLRFVIIDINEFDFHAIVLGGSGTRTRHTPEHCGGWVGQCCYHGIKEFRIKAKTRSRRFVKINAFEPCSDFLLFFKQIFRHSNGKVNNCVRWLWCMNHVENSRKNET